MIYQGIITKDYYDDLGPSEQALYHMVYQWFRPKARIWEDDVNGMHKFPLFSDYVNNCGKNKIRRVYKLNGASRLTPASYHIMPSEPIVKEVEVIKYVRLKYDVNGIYSEFTETATILRKLAANKQESKGIELALSTFHKLLEKHSK